MDISSSGAPMSKMHPSSPLRGCAIRACAKFMRPIARYLIRNGVGFREFSEISKEAFVEVSSADYGIRGRPTNVSRIAVLTGLTRKEVSRIRKNLESTVAVDGEIPKGRPELILARWFHDPEYSDANGEPLVIDHDGPKPSFASLVKDVGGDIPPGAMAKELVRAGSVVETDDGKLAAIQDVFIPEAANPQAVEFAGSALCDLAQTINNNLYGSKDRVPLLERRVVAQVGSKSHANQFVKAASEDAADLLKKLNDQAMDLEGQKDGDSQRVGIGIYVFRE